MEEEKNVKSIVKLISTSTIIASMCCLPSVVLVLFGLASVSSAAALSDTLYWGGEGYEWFRPTMLAIASISVIVGLVFISEIVVSAFDEVQRQRRKHQYVDHYRYLSYLLFNYGFSQKSASFSVLIGNQRFWNKYPLSLLWNIQPSSPRQNSSQFE